MTISQAFGKKTIAFILLVSLFASSLPFPALVYAEDAAPVTEATSAPEAGGGEAGTGGTASAEPAVVTTGDAVADSDGADQVNTNEIATTPTGPTVIAADNAAETTATTTADAGTGENTAQGGDGGALVDSGDAYASSNSVQLVNTNVIDSNGLILFEDLFTNLGIDLRTLDLSYFLGTYAGDSASTTCALCQAANSLSVYLKNMATTTSAVSASAQTGNNTAEGDGAAVITGDAYASANGVQFVNTNIVASNYLILALNNFGSILGDITLPGADFFEQLLAGAAGITGPLSAAIHNQAATNVSSSASAGTGDNAAMSNGGASLVSTGDALAAASSLSMVNSTAIGGGSVLLLFRIMGNWNGQIFGLPDGFTWERTPEGVIIRSANGEGGGAVGLGPTAVDVSNSALANLSVSANAGTGGNTAIGSSSDAGVFTGDAYAASNAIQVVNTTILGHNWIQAIFNIFGDLDGDIAFGHPDLWMGAAVQAGDPTIPGETVRFVFTVSNQGDADATNVRINTSHIQDLLRFSEGDLSAQGVSFALGDIPKGETKEFTVEALTGPVAPGDATIAPLSATATSDETDENTSNNTDHVSVTISNPAFVRTMGKGGAPMVTITKTADVATTTAPGTIQYTINVHNYADAILDAVLTDTMVGPDGKVVKKQTWDLDTLLIGEEVKITYSLVLDGSAALGDYTNTVVLSDPRTSSAHYPRAQHVVHVEAGICPQYLTKYIQTGASNDPEEVKKLQDFLINAQGETEVTMSGVYDEATLAAVKRFQQKHFDEIIAPWGGKEPSGYVYYTTVQVINNLYCNGARTFDLSSDQLSEIARIRSVLTAPPVAAPKPDDIEAPEPVETPLIGIAEPSAPALAEAPAPENKQWWRRLFSRLDGEMLAGALSAIKR